MVKVLVDIGQRGNLDDAVGLDLLLQALGLGLGLLSHCFLLLGLRACGDGGSLRALSGNPLGIGLVAGNIGSGFSCNGQRLLRLRHGRLLGGILLLDRGKGSCR